MPYITHPTGETTYYLDDNFTDPWKPCETILIQHGFARHAAFWYHWVPVLAKHYRVIRRDARGHGRSSTPDAASQYAYTVDTILAEIADTLDQLGLEQVHFVGESTGGIFGEAFAVRFPQRLLSLTVCSSPMVMNPRAQHLLAFGHADWPAACRELGSRGWGEQAAKLLGTDQLPDKAYVKWWLDQVGVPSGEGLGAHAELLAKIDSRPLVGRIKVPMLILAPANSAMTSVEEQMSIHDQVTGSRIVVIHGKGHEIFIDKAAECQQALLEFLGSLK